MEYTRQNFSPQKKERNQSNLRLSFACPVSPVSSVSSVVLLPSSEEYKDKEVSLQLATTTPTSTIYKKPVPPVSKPKKGAFQRQVRTVEIEVRTERLDKEKAFKREVRAYEDRNPVSPLVPVSSVSFLKKENEEKRLKEYAEERFAAFKRAVQGIPDFQQTITIEATEATEVTESIDGKNMLDVGDKIDGDNICISIRKEKKKVASSTNSVCNLTRTCPISSTVNLVEQQKCMNIDDGTKSPQSCYYYCNKSDCTYETKDKSSFERHLRLVHNIGENIKWHHCNQEANQGGKTCTYKAKLHWMVARHQKKVHKGRKRDDRPFRSKKMKSKNGILNDDLFVAASEKKQEEHDTPNQQFLHSTERDLFFSSNDSSLEYI